MSLKNDGRLWLQFATYSCGSARWISIAEATQPLPSVRRTVRRNRPNVSRKPVKFNRKRKKLAPGQDRSARNRPPKDLDHVRRGLAAMHRLIPRYFLSEPYRISRCGGTACVLTVVAVTCGDLLQIQTKISWTIDQNNPTKTTDENQSKIAPA